MKAIGTRVSSVATNLNGVYLFLDNSGIIYDQKLNKVDCQVSLIQFTKKSTYKQRSSLVKSNSRYSFKYFTNKIC
jgi:hypothetical protein